MRSVSCDVGQSFVIENAAGRTRVTVLGVERNGVRVGIEEPGMHYRESLIAAETPAASSHRSAVTLA